MFFISIVNIDPIRDGYNWYIYANNNSLRYIDPYGLDVDYLEIQRYYGEKYIREYLNEFIRRTLDGNLAEELRKDICEHSFKFFY